MNLSDNGLYHRAFQPPHNCKHTGFLFFIFLAMHSFHPISEYYYPLLRLPDSKHPL